jgi:hypothetical protein
VRTERRLDMALGSIRSRTGRTVRLVVVLAAVTVLMAACVSLPPAKPVTGVAQIAGKWQGSGITRGGARFVIENMTIRPDGTWELTVPTAANPGPRFVGTVRMVDGKLRSRSETSSRDSTWTLHEGEGRRVLRIVNDDGSSSGEVSPANP